MKGKGEEGRYGVEARREGKWLEWRLGSGRELEWKRCGRGVVVKGVNVGKRRQNGGKWWKGRGNGCGRGGGEGKSELGRVRRECVEVWL